MNEWVEDPDDLTLDDIEEAVETLEYDPLFDDIVFQIPRKYKDDIRRWDELDSFSTVAEWEESDRGFEFWLWYLDEVAHDRHQ